MFCEKCSNIVLQPVPDKPGLLEYQHYDTLELLRSSAPNCHLCRKLYFRFTGIVVDDTYKPRTSRNDSSLTGESAPNAVYPRDCQEKPGYTVDTEVESTSEELFDEIICVNEAARYNRTIPLYWGPVRIWYKPDFQGNNDGDVFTSDSSSLGFGLSSADYNQNIWKGLINYFFEYQFLIVNEQRSDVPKEYNPVQATEDYLFSKQTIEFAKRCMSRCYNDHTVCRSDAPLPLWIIEISDYGRSARLVSGSGRVARYMTLSYQWGTVDRSPLKMTSLTRANKLYLQGCIPLEQVPKTLADAIELTYRLGCSYLWIDALCITQDDKSELGEQIALMQDIYSGSHLTLFAAIGNDANAGLGSSNDISLIYPLQIKLTYGPTKESKTLWITDKTQHASYPPERRSLFYRGWVLQEQLLSRRSLILGANYVTWQCLSQVLSEAMPFCRKRIRDYDYDYEEQLEYLYHDDGLTHIRSWIWGLDPENINDRNFDEEKEEEMDRLSALDGFYSVVTDYTKRQLTYVSDVSPAISGLISRYEKRLKSSFHQGMYLDDYRGFLWYRENRHDTERPSGYPSWSWMSCFADELRFRVYLLSEEPKPEFAWQIAYCKNQKTVKRLTVTTWSRWVTIEPTEKHPADGEFSMKVPLTDAGTSYQSHVRFQLNAGGDHTGPCRRALLVLVARIIGSANALLLEPVAEEDDCFRRIGFAYTYERNLSSERRIFPSTELPAAVMESERNGDGPQVTTLYLV